MKKYLYSILIIITTSCSVIQNSYHLDVNSKILKKHNYSYCTCGDILITSTPSSNTDVKFFMVGPPLIPVIPYYESKLKLNQIELYTVYQNSYNNFDSAKLIGVNDTLNVVHAEYRQIYDENKIQKHVLQLDNAIELEIGNTIKLTNIKSCPNDTIEIKISNKWSYTPFSFAMDKVPDFWYIKKDFE